MGLNIHGVRVACYARSIGVDFETTMTIARQGLSLSPNELRRALCSFGHRPTDDDIKGILDNRYSERLLAYLGSKEVCSLDISKYEGATVAHDMNQPIADAHKARFSAVLDSGSLEHVFNVPVAVKNSMEMVRLGGHYICILPANNFFGHGFYQFGPEFFHGVFNEANGFVLEKLIAFEDVPNWRWHSANPDASWYEVENPLKLRERVTLVNDKPLSLIAIARRVALKSIFANTPQQSDYAARWEESERTKATTAPVLVPGSPPAVRPLPVRILKALLPSGLRLAVRKAVQPRPKPLGQGFKRRFFRRII
jgi:hypothetical protein